jgi:peptidoglycan-associated lipoprotein
MDSRPRSLEAHGDAAGESALAPERRRKETSVKKTCNATLWAAFAAAALMAAAGCQSTGNNNPMAERTTPKPGAPEAVENQPAPAEPQLQTVYFDFDRWNLRDDARRALRSNAELLQTNPAWGVVTVAGHCDERGSEEYNLALGDRRADAVKRYLVDLGVSSARLHTVSFGESRPAVPGEGEPAWSRNRRAELAVGTQQASR